MAPKFFGGELHGMYYTYILTTADNRYYIGSTGNLTERMKRHQRGEVSFTSSRRPVKLLHKEAFSSRSQAVLRERQIKNWRSRKSIERLIKTTGGPVV